MNSAFTRWCGNSCKWDFSLVGNRADTTTVPTIISDEPAWARDYPPAPGIKPLTILESLAKGFDDGAEFYLQGDCPIAVWCNRNFAVDYSQYPTREVRASDPISNGTKITEWQFRTLVCALHGIVKQSRTYCADINSSGD